MIGYASNPEPPYDDEPDAAVELDFDEREPETVEDALADRIADGYFHDMHQEPKRA